MYIQRYIAHFRRRARWCFSTEAGTTGRSVERVMGFATPEQVEQFLRDVPGVEQAVVRSGIILVKYWLEVSAENQTKRLKSARKST